MKNIAGVDGCKSGWIAFYFDGAMWSSRLYSTIDKLFEAIDSELILIDVPIGLRSNEQFERLCDVEARKKLNQRKSSVFPAPSRLALGYDEYSEASRINRKSTGRGLSKQSFAIIPKVREVDTFIQSEAYCASKKKIREVHPEICFWGLNGSSEMKHKKKDTLGRWERMHLLKQYLPEVDDLFSEARRKYKKKDVADDDIIDALCCAITAMHGDVLSTIPVSPEEDNNGIPMEIVYYDAKQSLQRTR